MTILSIPITKAGNVTIEVDLDTIPEAVYLGALEEGFKTYLNKGMSKITGLKDMTEEELSKAREAALVIATKNLEALKSGTVKRTRAKAAGAKVPGVVLTAARRIAKEVLKDEIRAAGLKISHIAPRDLTRLANERIAEDPSYIAQAQAEIDARNSATSTIDQASALAKLQALGLHEDPKLVAAAEAEKAKRKETLSAAQAGKPGKTAAPRKAKAEPAQPVAH